MFWVLIITKPFLITHRYSNGRRVICYVIVLPCGHNDICSLNIIFIYISYSTLLPAWKVSANMFADLFEHTWAYELGYINMFFLMVLCVARNITNMRKDKMLNGMVAINRNHSDQFHFKWATLLCEKHYSYAMHINCQTNNTYLEHMNLYNRWAMEKCLLYLK